MARLQRSRATEESRAIRRAASPEPPVRSGFWRVGRKWLRIQYDGLMLAGTAPSATNRSSRCPARQVRWHLLVSAFQAISSLKQANAPTPPMVTWRWPAHRTPICDARSLRRAGGVGRRRAEGRRRSPKPWNHDTVGNQRAVIGPNKSPSGPTRSRPGGMPLSVAVGPPGQSFE